MVRLKLLDVNTLLTSQSCYSCDLVESLGSLDAKQMVVSRPRFPLFRLCR